MGLSLRDELDKWASSQENDEDITISDMDELEEIFKRRMLWELEAILEDFPENGEAHDLYLMIDTLARKLKG